MDVQRVGGAFRATDAAKNTVRVGTDGWRTTDEAPSPYDVLSADRSDTGVGPDEMVRGETSTLRLPPASARVREIGGDRRRYGVNVTDPETVEGRILLRLCTKPRIFVRFDGTARLERTDEWLVVEYAGPTAVTVVFRSLVEEASDRITIRRRAEDLAKVLPALATANARTTPDRTWPASRHRPPDLQLGDALSIPADVEADRTDTGIELAVPDELAYVVTGAPLAHYLGARVRLGVDRPRLNGPDWRRDLPRLPDYQRAVNGLLRRVFFLDCLARSAGPYGDRPSEADALTAIGLDAASLYDASLAERIRRYLAAPFDRVSDGLPDWHLAMYVEPTFERLPALPHLLERLSAIYLPESDQLDKCEWITLSLNEGKNAANGPTPIGTVGASDGSGGEFTRVQREVSNVDLVKPNLRPAEYHGWLAPDVPIDVFKTFPEAYENRDDYIDDGPLSVVAVLNNAEMRSEHDAAVHHYRSRAQELNLDLTVRENVRAGQLARVFESRWNLVHFIGHRDERGLECANGFLSLSSIDESNSQSFFLNACGSYHEGVELIRKGSVAGAVTFEAVTDRQAAEVGTTFARLLMNGYCIERALDWARQRVMTPKDYVVVGDGTHVLTTKSDNPLPLEVQIADDDDGYRLRYSQKNPRLVGAQASETVHGGETSTHLATNDRTYRVCPDQLAETLDHFTTPVRTADGLYWPDEFDRL